MTNVTPERWQQVAELYQSAREHAPADRQAFLDNACGTDAQLRRELESLLAQATREGPLDQPIWDVAADAVARERRIPMGARVGPYRVDALIGFGGMGEVYRAHDMNLGRAVALKVLPASFTDDRERLARFQREAEVLASLNHPHIAMIHGLEVSTLDTDEGLSEIRALVLELVDGETLADRIRCGRIPVDDALPIARQIAEAVEAAHALGVVHRDLKPANIKVKSDGTVKVLDFGLAKPIEPGSGIRDSGSGNVTASPTITTPAMSGVGVILGTAAYMAPEQAKGHPADKRSDIWAFGCVLYEMLTGRRAFQGDDVSDTLAAVLRGEPDWNALPTATPEPIRRLLRRALQKNRTHRLADLADARLEIEEARLTPLSQTASTRSPRYALLMLATTVAILAAVLAVLLFRPVAAPPEMRVELSVPETADPAAMAIAPDGTKVVYVAGEAGQRQLWVRFLNNVTPRPIPGTEGATSPFWFPDGRTIGFTADTGMKRADIASGSVRPLQSRGGDAAVNAAGVILIEGGTGPIRRIDPGATEAVAATRVEPFSAGHRAPHFLPDGRRFLFYSSGSRAIYLGDLDTLDSTRLMDADSGAVYAASGHLLFVRQGTLFAHGFDPARLELRGEPMEIARQVGVGLMGRPAVSASAAGPIVYRTTTAEARSQFAWFNRSGAELQTIGEPLSSVRSFSTSPDGLHISLQMAVGGNNDIWLLETSRGVVNRLTSDPGLQGSAIWSPDGTRIVYQTDRGGTRAMVARSASGIGGEEVLFSSPDPKLTRDWSPDGSHILYLSGGPSGADLWALPLAGEREPFPVANTGFDEVGGQFSPDGKWIAYSSNESGRFEIYVQPFPGNGPKTRISTGGGAQVRWSRDGRELFYIGLDERLMSVAIRLDSSKGAVEHAGQPAPLFTTRVGGAVQQAGFPTQYAVSADGQRFLMKKVPDGLTTSPLTLVLNWKPDR